jgi:thiol-disulfide isomerase/thioredoxin
MKRNLILLVALTFNLLAHAQGINFEAETTPWSDILAKAKAQNKLVFVDAYTTWCGPCKWMVANTFPDKAVGEVFNANFINAKIDMEKGEGIDIAKKYSVRAYPTYIFVNGDGELVHRSLGGMPADKFVKVGEAANDPEQQLLTVRKKFESGERSEEFLKKSAKTFADVYELAWAEESALAYMKLQDNWLTSENIRFIRKYAHSVNGELFQHIVKNYETYEKELPKGNAEEFVYRQAVNGLTQKFYVRKNNTYDLEGAKKYAKSTFPTAIADKASDFVSLTVLKFSDNTPAYFAGIAQFLEKYPSKDPNSLNEYAWLFYENTDDKALLEKALTWSLTSIEIYSNYAFMDTAASLYFKLGKKKEAKEFAERAIDMAKKEGADASETEELLRKIGNL